jgi:hypothetical protein
VKSDSLVVLGDFTREEGFLLSVNAAPQRRYRPTDSLDRLTYAEVVMWCGGVRLRAAASAMSNETMLVTLTSALRKSWRESCGCVREVL